MDGALAMIAPRLAVACADALEDFAPDMTMFQLGGGGAFFGSLLERRRLA